MANDIERRGVQRWMLRTHVPAEIRALARYSLDRPWANMTWFVQRRLQACADRILWPEAAQAVRELRTKAVPKAPSVEGLSGWALTTRPVYLPARDAGDQAGDA